MTNEKIISKLSELPIGELDNLRLLISLASLPAPSKSNDFYNGLSRWADRINKALEQKQLDYYSGYEEIDENSTIGI